MAHSFTTIVANIEISLQSAANMAVYIETLKGSGASKASTLQKVATITELAAASSESVPEPHIKAASALVLAMVEDVYGSPAVPDPPPPPPGEELGAEKG